MHSSRLAQSYSFSDTIGRQREVRTMTTTTPKKVHYGISRGLNLDDIDHTTQAEIDTYLNYARNNHVPLYLQTSHTVWLENRPDMMKLHHRGPPNFRPPHTPEAGLIISRGQLHPSIAQ